MRRPIALIAALTLSFTLSASAAGLRVGVPHVRSAPTVDGNVIPREWRDAVRVQLSANLGHALMMHDGKYLYIALVHTKPGIGSVCVRGKTGVRVLHASAALGTAAFEPEKGKWRMTRGFTWTNRDTGESAAAMADRRKMLAAHGWFANTSPAATRMREYQVPIRGQQEVPIALAFLTFTPEEKKLYYWPTTLEDDCAESELASGFTDREYTFDPTKWGIAVLE